MFIQITPLKKINSCVPNNLGRKYSYLAFESKCDRSSVSPDRFSCGYICVRWGNTRGMRVSRAHRIEEVVINCVIPHLYRCVRAESLVGWYFNSTIRKQKSRALRLAIQLHHPRLLLTLTNQNASTREIKLDVFLLATKPPFQHEPGQQGWSRGELHSLYTGFI